MQSEVYAAARTIAPVVHAYFERRLTQARSEGLESLAALPATETIEALIDAAFWASLRREEGYTPKISLAYLAPRDVAQPLVLQRPLSISPSVLTRISPAVERPGIHLGVWHEGEELCVWGTTCTVPKHCFVLEVAAPGLLVVKHHSGEEAGKFANVTVLEGEQIKVVDEHASSDPECPALLTSLLGFDAPTSWSHSVNVLVQLAISMRAHGRGGCILVVPFDSECWTESIVPPLAYQASQPYSELGKLSQDSREGKRPHLMKDELRRTVDWIAGLTAVDGAVVINDRYELLGFGAKITRRHNCAQVEHVVLTEPIQGSVATLVHSEKLGGTRHLSAAQFVHDQQDAIALVASQDGQFTIFEWSPCGSSVHAHRVEALLL